MRLIIFVSISLCLTSLSSIKAMTAFFKSKIITGELGMRQVVASIDATYAVKFIQFWANWVATGELETSKKDVSIILSIVIISPYYWMNYWSASELWAKRLVVVVEWWPIFALVGCDIWILRSRCHTQSQTSYLFRIVSSSSSSLEGFCNPSLLEFIKVFPTLSSFFSV